MKLYALFILTLLLATNELSAIDLPTPNRTAKTIGSTVLVTNGNFDSNNAWTYGSGASRFHLDKTNWVAKCTGSIAAALAQNFTVSDAGVYRVRFKAKSVSAENPQRILVHLNGVRFFNEIISETSFTEFATRPLRLPKGAVSITFETNQDNAVAYLDDVTIQRVSEWNVTSSWAGGVVPTASSDVMIPSGVAMVITNGSVAATVQVEGELLAANEDVSLNARWVLVSGPGSALEVGTPGARTANKFTLTLTGNNIEEDIDGAGSKFLMAMNSGWIDLHGASRTQWTKLQQTAEIGATTIKLDAAVNWPVGAEIVIAASGYRPAVNENGEAVHESEKRSIIATSTVNGRTTLTLNAALKHKHLAEKVTHTRPANAGLNLPARTWTVDMRAEVGLLSRNILVQGDASSASTGFGGHVMLMFCTACSTDSGYGRFSDVEFYRMGQKKRMGRYPIHWHMQGSKGKGQFMRNCAVHESYNRAATIHGSWHVKLIGNVFFRHVGHGVFLEDGSEIKNTIRDNLVIQTIRPKHGDELLPTDNSHDEAQNMSPAAFWITNPDNSFTGNVAADTLGSGFWFALPTFPGGLSASDPRFSAMTPQLSNLGEFDGNSAHSLGLGIDVHDGFDRFDHTLNKNRSWTPPVVSKLKNTTAWGCNIAIYTGVAIQSLVEFTGNCFSDNGVHTQLASRDAVTDSLWVAASGHLPAVPENPGPGFPKPQAAFRIYDGPGQMIGGHLVGYQSKGLFVPTVFHVVGASQKHTNPIVQDLTFTESGPPNLRFEDYNGFYLDTLASNFDWSIKTDAFPQRWGEAVWDMDGSLIGVGSRTLITNHPFMRSAGDKTLPNATNAYCSNKRFNHFFVRGFTDNNKNFQDFRYLHTECSRYLRTVNLSTGLATTDSSSTSFINAFTETGLWFKHQAPMIKDAGEASRYEYKIKFFTKPTEAGSAKAQANSATNFTQRVIQMQDSFPGDRTTVQLEGLIPVDASSWSLESESGATWTLKASVEDLRLATSNAYHRATNGDLWLRFISTNATNIQNGIIVNWVP